eukprot:Gb_12523 [translate_table: standard]
MGGCLPFRKRNDSSLESAPPPIDSSFSSDIPSNTPTFRFRDTKRKLRYDDDDKPKKTRFHSKRGKSPPVRYDDGMVCDVREERVLPGDVDRAFDQCAEKNENLCEEEELFINLDNDEEVQLWMSKTLNIYEDEDEKKELSTDATQLDGQPISSSSPCNAVPFIFSAKPKASGSVAIKKFPTPRGNKFGHLKPPFPSTVADSILRPYFCTLYPEQSRVAATKCKSCEKRFKDCDPRYYCSKCGFVFCRGCCYKKVSNIVDVERRLDYLNSVLQVPPKRLCDKCYHLEALKRELDKSKLLHNTKKIS